MTALAAVVVGCGRIGSRYDDNRPDPPPLSHAGAYVAHPTTRLSAGVDPSREARAAFERRWNVTAVPELDALTIDEPFVASICTPPEGRADVVDEVVAAGARAIWIEKPLAATVDDGERIVRTCATAGIPLQVNFHRRFDPTHQDAAARIRAGGSPRHLDFRFSGTLANFGSHAFDLFRWFAGEPTWIAAQQIPACSSLVTVRSHEGSATFLQIDSGRTTVFDVDAFTPDARVTLTAVGEHMLVAPAEPDELFIGVRRHAIRGGPATDGIAASMTGGVTSLVDHLERGTPLLCDGTDGLASLRILAAAETTLRTGRPLELGR